jgi:hypothetical protein
MPMNETIQKGLMMGTFSKILILTIGIVTVLGTVHSQQMTVSWNGIKLNWTKESAIVINQKTKTIDTLYCNGHINGLGHEVLESNELDSTVSDENQLDSIDSEIAADNPEDPDDICEWHTLSIVGPYLSYMFTESHVGFSLPHPEYGCDYKVIRFDTREIVNLTDIFPEHEIVKALVSDSLIQEQTAFDTTHTLAELLDDLDDNNADIIFRGMMSSFAFYDVTHDTVVVEIYLPPQHQGYAGNYTTFQIKLRIPKPYSRMFHRSKKEGSLLKDMDYSD